MAQTSIDKQQRESSATIQSGLQNAIKRVTDDLEKRRYNTAIATMMEWTNLVGDEGGIVAINDLRSFILLLAPFAPHLCEELWQLVNGYKDFEVSQSVHTQPWPVVDAAKILAQDITITIQVNGKLRDVVTVSKDISNNQSDVETIAKKSEKVQKFLAGNTVKKVIFVPGKIINFVM